MTLDLSTLEVATRTVEEQGLRLPYRRSIKNWVTGIAHVEEGEAFIPIRDLVDLAEQEEWDSQFGKVLLIEEPEQTALEQAGLLERETRGGVHRTDALLPLLARLELY